MHVRTYAPPCGAPGFAHTYVGETQKSAIPCELGIGTNAIAALVSPGGLLTCAPTWGNGTTRTYATWGH